DGGGLHYLRDRLLQTRTRRRAKRSKPAASDLSRQDPFGDDTGDHHVPLSKFYGLASTQPSLELASVAELTYVHVRHTYQVGRKASAFLGRGSFKPNASCQLHLRISHLPGCGTGDRRCVRSLGHLSLRSEERRVGKECRYRRAEYG